MGNRFADARGLLSFHTRTGTELSGTELIITPEIYPLEILARLPQKRWWVAPRLRSPLSERAAFL